MTPEEYRQHLIKIVMAGRALVDVPVDEQIRDVCAERDELLGVLRRAA